MNNSQKEGFVWANGYIRLKGMMIDIWRPEAEISYLEHQAWSRENILGMV